MQSIFSMRLGGVTLNVRDLDSAKNFYSQLPGARLVRDEPDIASFEFGEARVSLKKSPESGFHLEMEGGEGEQSGLPNVVEKRDGKVFLADPDGHRIEVEKSEGKEESHGSVHFNPERDEENAGLG